MFETTGIINEKVLKILKKYSISPNFKNFLNILIGISALFALICVPLSLKLSVSFVFLILVLIFEYYFAINIFYKKSVSIMVENSGKEGFEFKVFFNEIGAVVNNLSIGATVNLKYDLFVRLEETTDMYFLFTKSNQYIIVFKNCLDVKQANDFKTFIKERCKNIK